jgi:hypothetical protein
MKLSVFPTLCLAVLFSLLFISCKKNADLRNKTSVVVTCTKLTTDPNGLSVGSEIVLTSTGDNKEYVDFAILPTTVRFENLEPGSYKVSGRNTASINIESFQLSQDEEKTVNLQFQ